jgi:ectoine hydroxylase-related dioxygenase (phytanoyl-CoA dioxygenase family)
MSQVSYIQEMSMSLATDTAFRTELEKPFPIEPKQIERFRTQGYIKLKQVLSPAVLEYYGNEITQQVFRLNTLTKPMHERTTYEKAFLQIMNLWTKSQIVKEFVFSKRLARLAAELMGVRGVRLYHDQALYKEGGGGITPWHADQYYWPLSNANTCTVWIPLQQAPMEMGPLAFAAGSQNLVAGRDLVISDKSEDEIRNLIAGGKYRLDENPFDLGEVSYHYGWTYHRAGRNVSNEARKVMTIIYMDADMRLAKPANENQQNDWNTWMPTARIGEVIDTPLNPVLYQG